MLYKPIVYLCCIQFLLCKSSIFLLFLLLITAGHIMTKHFSSEILSKYLFYDKAHITRISLPIYTYILHSLYGFSPRIKGLIQT